MTDINLITAVRAALGKLPETNTVDIENEDILREAAFILSRISSHITKKVLRSITTEAGTRDYDVDENTRRVQAVLSSEEVEDSFGDETWTSIVSSQSGNDPVNSYNYPSLRVINQMRRRRSLSRYSFTFHPVEKKLKLDPTPSQSGETIWYLSIEPEDWTLNNVPVEFEELLVTGTTWKCLNIVALRRSTEGGIERGGGRVDYPADSLLRAAEKLKEDFYDELDIKVRLFAL